MKHVIYRGELGRIMHETEQYSLATASKGAKNQLKTNKDDFCKEVFCGTV